MMYRKTLWIVCCYFFVSVSTIYSDLPNIENDSNYISTHRILENEGSSDSDECKSIADCNYLGQCRKSGGKNICRCYEGISGKNCTVVEECRRNPNMCGDDPEAECSLSINSYSSVRKAICKCKEGNRFDIPTKKCVTQKSCLNDKQCQNYGTCDKDDESKSEEEYCKCHYGTSGDFCERIEECISNPKLCGDGDDVECRFNSYLERAYCQCKDPNHRFDWKEKKCVNRTECKTNDECLPLGLCTNKCQSYEPCLDYENIEDKKSCHCVEGNSGQNCEVIDDCVNGIMNCGDNAICKFSYHKGITARAYCLCTNSSQKFDEVEKQCKDCDCGPKGTCLFRNGNKACTCEPDALDMGNQCEDCKCGEGSTGCILKNGVKECLCKPGFKHLDGTCQAFCDEEYKCENNGTCVNNNCVCLAGTEGLRCSKISECENELCGKNDDILCSYDSIKKKAYCLCKDADAEYDSQNKVCKECACGTHSNGCKFEGNKTICFCKPGFTQGDYGICKAKCDVEHKCANGGRCLNDICMCLPGTGGSYCEKIYACEDNLCGKNSSVLCQYDERRQKANCACKDKDKIFDSYDQSCKECMCGDSLNTEKCEFANGKKVCHCKEKYSYSIKKDECKKCYCGEYSKGCSFDEKGVKVCQCKPQYVDYIGTCRECSCGENGVCNIVEKYFQLNKNCTCDLGYSDYKGTCYKCDCGANGKCAFSKYSKKTVCTCDAGFADNSGKCQVCDCGPSFKCSFKNKRKFCECRSGYEDIDGFCTDIDECVSTKKCTGEGRTCVNTVGSYKCKCQPGYKKHSDSAQTCQKIDESKPDTAWKVGYAILSVGFIIIIAVLVYIIFRLKRNQR